MEDQRITAFQADVHKVLTHLHGEFAKLQTGRASAALVEGILVDAYGQMQPLKAVAGISIQDAKTIVLQPWDKSIMQAVEIALSKADLGASPVNDGVIIRLSLPKMTEERRQQMTKVVAKLGEEARISIRQQRQRIHDEIKASEKDEDVRYTLLETVEKAVKAGNEKVEESVRKKEEEVMTI